VGGGKLPFDLYLEMESVSDPQISPDGRQNTYTRGWIDKVNYRRQAALWIMNANLTGLGPPRHSASGSASRSLAPSS
jgi:hypothetical protein